MVFALLPCIGPLLGRQLPVRFFTVADGLASNFVNVILRDSHGFLWFGTSDGLSRFDGSQFTNFGVDQGLPDRAVTDMVTTRSGDLWIATPKAVCRLNASGTGPRLETYTVDPNARMVNSLADDRADGVWLGTENGLYQIAKSGPNQWKMRAVDIGAPRQRGLDRIIEALAVDPSGTLWIGTGTGLYRRFPDGPTNRYATADGLPHAHVTVLLSGRHERLWVGTWEGLCRLALDPHSKTPLVEAVYPTKEGLDSVPVASLLESEDGRV